MTSSKKAMSVPGRVGLTVLGILQVTFTFLAYWDLAHRDKREIKGSKPVWIPVILVDWVGPAAYFLVGIKR